MKSSKKILIIFTSLIISSIIAGIISWSSEKLFNTPFTPLFVLSLLIQLLAPTIYSKFIETKIIKATMEEYKNKPYKDYIMPLKCQYCGKQQNVVIDLAKNEYICETAKGGCGRKNAMYINIMTATISHDN